MNGRCILIQVPGKDQCVRSVLERPQVFLNFVSKEGKDPAGVVAILDEILHEVVMTRNLQKGEGRRVKANRCGRGKKGRKFAGGMGVRNAAAQETPA
jgi:hypothetical protein